MRRTLRRLLLHRRGWTPAALTLVGRWRFRIGDVFTDVAGTNPTAVDGVIRNARNLDAGGTPLTSATLGASPLLKSAGGSYRGRFDAADDSLSAAIGVPAAFLLGFSVKRPFDGADAQAVSFEWPGFVAGAGGGTGLYYSSGWFGAPLDCSAGTAVVYEVVGATCRVYAGAAGALTFTGGYSGRPWVGVRVGAQFDVSQVFNGDLGAVVLASGWKAGDPSRLCSYLYARRPT